MADNYSVFNPTVDLNPYSNQIADIQRRQRMAQLLQQQGMEPLESQVVGGQVIRTSPWQVLAKALQTGLGAYQGSQADKAAADLREQMAYDQRQKEADVASAGQQIMGRLYGEKPTQYDKNGLPIGREPYTPPDLTPDEMGNTPRAPKPITLQPGQAESGSRNRSFAQSISEGDQLGEITPTAKYQYDPSGAFQMAMTPAGTEAMKGNPLMASLLAQMVKPKEAEEFGTTPVRGADGNYYLISKSGRMVPTNVAGFDKEATPTDLSKLIAERDALPANSPLRATYNAAIARHTERSPGVNVSIDTGASKQLVGNFADELKESHKAAIASAKILPQLNQLDKLTEQGTYTGAMAKGAVGASEFLQSFGINVDADTLARTKQFEALKNQLVLQMMAANGGARGFSKEETALLDNAFPQIVNNPQARKQIVQIFRNMAQAGIDQYNGQLNDFKRAYPTAVIPYQPIETEDMRYLRWLESQKKGGR